MPLAAIAAIGVAGSIGGAAIASHGATSAANTQANAANYAAQLQKQAADESLAFQKQQYATQQAQAQPWLQSGYGALANLDYLLGIAPPTGSPASSGGTLDHAAPVASPAMSPIALSHADMGRLLQDGPQSLISRQTPITTSGTNTSLPTAATPNLAAMVNPNLGGFGSLMTPWNEQFKAPTGLTEQNDPGFQARLKLGQDALERSAAAKGGVLTGGTAKDLNSFAQDYASNEYGNVYNRAFNDYSTRYNQFEQGQTNQFNRLAALSGVGQTTAAQLGTLGQQSATNIGNTLTNSAAQIGQQANNAAAARASGYAASANAWGGAVSNSANSVTQLLMLKQLGMI
jgi:hypothetical protein